LPITLTLSAGSTEINYPTQNTDASGFFTVTVSGVPSGLYTWRVKGPKFLSNAGTVSLPGIVTTQVEMGPLRAGDCNNDNRINVADFNIMKNAFSRGLGDPGYDDRADLNGDNAINVIDFNFLKINFGQGGS
jgi:hypothetical protein